MTRVKKNTGIKEAKAEFEGGIEAQQVVVKSVTVDDKLDYPSSQSKEVERRLATLEGRVEALYAQDEQDADQIDQIDQIDKLERRLELELTTRKERMDALNDIETVTHRRLADLEGNVKGLITLRGEMKRLIVWQAIMVAVAFTAILIISCTEAFAHSTSVTGELIDRRIMEHKANPEAWLKVETADKASSNYYKSLCYTDGCCVTCTNNSDCKGKDCVECVREGCNDINGGGRL